LVLELLNRKAEARQDAAVLGKELLPAGKENWPEPLANQSYVCPCPKSISG